MSIPKRGGFVYSKIKPILPFILPLLFTIIGSCQHYCLFTNEMQKSNKCALSVPFLLLLTLSFLTECERAWIFGKKLKGARALAFFFSFQREVKAPFAG